MTYSEFKQSDLHKCLLVTGELLSVVGKIAFRLATTLIKAVGWLFVQAYKYVMK